MAELPFVAGPAGAEPELRAAAEAAAAQWGLPSPELLRVSMNGVFVAGDVLLRVARPSVPAIAAIRLADLLERAGVRTARPARRESIDAGGGLAVTAWERIEVVPGLDVDWAVVGAAVARVHRLDPSEVRAVHPLPWCGDFPWWDYDALVTAAAAHVDAEALAALRACAERHRGWQDTARAAPPVVCHGDVHPGNVLVGRDGPVLIDWDLVCLGPPGWDHAPMMTWTERWGGAPGVYEAFAGGYGLNLRADPVAAALAELRLLAATLMRVRAGLTDPAAAAEAARRLQWWRGAPDAPIWKAM